MPPGSHSSTDRLVLPLVPIWGGGAAAGVGKGASTGGGRSADFSAGAAEELVSSFLGAVGPIGLQPTWSQER